MDDANTKAWVSNIAIGVGIVGLGVGTYLFIKGASPNQERAPAKVGPPGAASNRSPQTSRPERRAASIARGDTPAAGAGGQVAATVPCAPAAPASAGTRTASTASRRTGPR